MDESVDILQRPIKLNESLSSSIDDNDAIGNSLLLSFISISATIITITLYFGPYSTMKQIILKKSTGSVAGVQFIASTLSCFLWVAYSLLASNKTMFFVNTTGMTLSAYYVYNYWKYSNNPNNYLMKIIIGIMIGILILSVSLVSKDHEVRINNLGFLSCIICVLMFASPLEKLSSVIKLKNSDGMLKSVAINSLLCGVIWTIFGFLVDDIYIYAPNIFASILSTIQYSLILFYPPSPIIPISNIDSDF